MSKDCNCNDCCETVITRQGEQGARGERGPSGVNGTNGANGTNGVDGDSAYEVAVENGFIGTEEEWLDSLVGPQGEPGIDPPLVWNSLSPYLVNTWFQAGGQPGEFAFDSVKELLYLRGNVGFTGTPGSSIVFTLPNALVGGGTSFLSHTICYEYATPEIAPIRIGLITAASFSFRYDGGETNPVLSLDSTPIIRMK